MRERVQPIPDRLPSTTRAVAWGALFFSLLSFAFSAGTFFLTYQDGRLVRNLKDLSGALADQVAKARAADPAVHVESPDHSPEDTAPPVDAAKLSDRMGRVGAMIEEGDDRAKYYLDNLSSDLSQLREYASEKSEAWLGPAVDSINQVRADLQQDAPAAAARLRELADEVRARAAAAGEDLGAQATRLRDGAAGLGEDLRAKGAEARQSLDQLNQTGKALRDAGQALQNFRKPPAQSDPNADPDAETLPADAPADHPAADSERAP